VAASDALEMLDAVQPPSGASSSSPATPPVPEAPMGGAASALADMDKTPEQLRSEMTAKPEQSGSGIGHVLSEAGKFAFTAGARGLGGLAEFALDPLSQVRSLIDPRLERLEQSIRPHPGEAAADTAFAATRIPEYQPGGALDRIGLSAATGAAAGGPFGPWAALLGGLGGFTGQTGKEAATTNGMSPENSERVGIAAGLLPSVAAPLARGPTNYVVGKGKETLGPLLSKPYREGLVGEQLRSGASDLDALKSSLMVDQPGPLTQSRVPNSLPTTFQITGDMGLGQLERGARTRDATPFLERAAEQNKARVTQVEALAPENAAPSAVRDLLKQHLEKLDTEGEANIRAAQQNAQQAFDQAGGTLSPDLYGSLMRDQLEGAKATTKAAESKLWQAIDPEGKLTINAAPVRDAASNILSEIPRTAKPPEGEEAAVLQLAQSGETMPFSDFAALRGRLLGAIREERVNGQTPALRRMQMLRSAMDETISSAADNAAQADAGLLGRISGELSDFGTATQARTASGGYDGAGASTVSRGNAPAAPGLFGAAGNSNFGSGNAAGRSSASRPPPKPQDIVEFLTSRGGVRDDGGELRAMDTNRVNGGYGTGGVGKGSFGILSREKGLPPDHAREIAEEAGYLKPGSSISDLYDAIHDSVRGRPHYSDADADIVANWDHYTKTGEAAPSFDPISPANFDQAAASRYRAAAGATKDRAQTFNNQIVGPTLQERGSEYRMLESRVPEHFLNKGPEGVQAFLSAGGDVATIRDALAADLRHKAMAPDGTLAVSRYQSWLRGRQNTLRAFPELEQTLGNAAKAQDAVDAVSATSRAKQLEFQKGAARHFLNAEPEKAVQAALASKNPVADFRELSRLVGGDAEAKAGLQRAVADHIADKYIGNTEAGTSGVGTIKSDVFQTFMTRNSRALRQVFSPDQVKMMHRVAEDLQQANRSIASSKIPGQSNTAQDQALQGGKVSVMRQHLAEAALSTGGGISGYLLASSLGVPPMVGAAVGAVPGVAKAAISSMKAAGVERTNQLLAEALLHPEIARTLLLKPNPANRPFIARSLRSAFGRIAAASASREAAEKWPTTTAKSASQP